MTDRDSKDPAPGEGEAENEPEITELEEPSEGIREPEVEGKQCSYTVRYMDVKDKTILQAIAGVGVEGRTIAIIQPVIDGYELCEGQKESFKLSSDHMVLSIYYERKSVTSPSEARKVDWNLYFVERENHGNEILKTQQGRTEEGKSLIIDFPETILGADRYYYHSLVSSPWSVIVSGNGTQKYFIEFERGDRLPEEADPDQEAKDRLKRWLEIAKDADIRLSGREPSDQQIITTSIEESNDRLLNLVSMTDGTERKEVYLIAKKHVPNTVIISRTFRNVKNLSDLIMDEFTIAYEKYTIMRVGFERSYDENSCNHDYQVTDKVNTTCMSNGHEMVLCRKCGKEEIVILPADVFAHETYIGITRSYIGTTWKGSYEQLDDNSLMARKEVFQFLQDKVFILSVDEALKYRDVLWKFYGSDTNNPESQISAYSKGYYLRTPQDVGLEDFLYGEGIYAVSLVDGNIQPVNVKETGFGIRPAMAVLQG